MTIFYNPSYLFKYNRFYSPLIPIIILSFSFIMGGQSLAATITVSAGGNLQGAINNAQPGDTIIIDAGITLTGPFTLKNKNGAGVITIQSSRAAELTPSIRVLPSDAPKMAKIVTPGSGQDAINTEAGAHNYTLIGLEVTQANSAAFSYGLINLGDGSNAQNTLASVPHDLILDRCYIHGDATAGVKRGIGLNSAETTVKNSYISDCKVVGQDSQAIGGWNGPGPFHILNNYLEGAGENLLFGGSDTSIANLVPSDIEIRGNYFFKPLSWRTQSWSVKNLLEFKNAQRVIVDNNTFENNWLNAQTGESILFTPRNQDGSNVWTVVQNITFANNRIINVGAGFNILGIDYLHPSQRTRNITIRNNYLKTNPAMGGRNEAILMTEGADSVVFDHNTFEQDGLLMSLGGAPETNFTFTNNVGRHNQYGIIGDSHGPGNDSINFYLPGVVFAGNVITGANASQYPVNNFYPADLSGLNNLKGTDGEIPGYHQPAQGVISEPVVRPTPTPIPTPASTPVNQRPVADISGPYSGTATQPVQFDASKSYDSDGSVVDYQWNFGDGSAAAGATPTHLYAAAGTFNVTLTVKDNAGATSSIGTTATISSPLAAPAAPTSLTLSGFSGGGNATILNWQDNSSNETSFSVERGSSQSQMTPITNVPADTTVYTDASASSMQTYYYRVCASNKMGFSCSNVAMRKGLTAARKDKKNLSTVVVNTTPVVTSGSNGGKPQGQSNEEKKSLRVAMERSQNMSRNLRGRQQ